MRLLIVNPNTSHGVTARINAAAQAVAAPGDRLTTVSASSGPALIVTESDGRAATVGVLEAIAAHQDPCDGIVLASFGDTGAAEVKARYPDTPVIGIAEAAFLEARRVGGPFAIVTFAPEVAGPLAIKAEEHGMSHDLIRVAAPDLPLAHDPADVAEALLPVLHALCVDCATEGARSVIMGGGPLAGLANRMSANCPVPVIDGTQSAIAHLRSVAAQRTGNLQPARHR